MDWFLNDRDLRHERVKESALTRLIGVLEYLNISKFFENLTFAQDSQFSLNYVNLMTLWRRIF